MEIYNPDKLTFEEQFREENILGDCEKTLSKLDEGRIFDVTYNEIEKSFVIGENCDRHFAEELTKEMLEDLSEAFEKMARMLD
ncbi:Uncharacterised protein [Lysinibacillus sphaericus]|nr:Uncharacterised protein [Lysinibacillus sphaericus]